MAAIYTDQMGREIKLPAPPRRIISLVPSQTELLAWLGLHEEVVGITRFCIHPTDWFRQKTRIGGTKQIRRAAIDALRPDLIIGNKEENEKTQIDDLAATYPVWMSDVSNLPDALEMIQQLGQVCNRADAAKALATRINQAFEGLGHPRPLRTAYLIWREPFMVAASGTFIHDMLQRAGFSNVFAHYDRYPVLSEAQLAQSGAELILLSSEPYPFKASHLAEIQAICPDAVIQLADGEAFSWYGSRLLHSPSYFYELYHTCKR